MKIDLNRLDPGSGSLSAAEEITVDDAFGEPTLVQCEVTVDYNQTGGAFYFHGSIRGTFDTHCHRCLTGVAQPIGGEFDVVVRRTGGEVEPAEDGEDLRDYVAIALNQHEFSLDPFIYENAVVSIPMLILCQDECKGLCSKCGADLNRESCRCEPVADSRWQALKDVGSQETDV